MRTHASIITDAGAQRVADLLQVSIITVRSWGNRDSIPAPYWRELTDAGLTTADELMEGARRQPAQAEVRAA